MDPDSHNPEALTDSSQWVPEQLLGEQLNIPAKKLRAMRPDGVQADKRTGMRWPRPAADALAKELGMTLTPPEDKPISDGTETLTVVSVARGFNGEHFPNPKVIQARRENGSLVFVRVKHSGKYRPFLHGTKQPMQIKAKPAPMGTWWNLVSREPAYPAAPVI